MTHELDRRGLRTWRNERGGPKCRRVSMRDGATSRRDPPQSGALLSAASMFAQFITRGTAHATAEFYETRNLTTCVSFISNRYSALRNVSIEAVVIVTLETFRRSENIRHDVSLIFDGSLIFDRCFVL